MAWYVITKLLKINDKEKILKCSQKKKLHYSSENIDKIYHKLPSEAMKVRRQWNDAWVKKKKI